MTQTALTGFFGWMTVIHFAILITAGVFLLILRNWASGLHAALFGLDRADVSRTYFNWLAAYKLLIFVTALVPWLALRLM